MRRHWEANRKRRVRRIRRIRRTFTIWQIIAFPWKNHPFGNLLFVTMGLVGVWVGESERVFFFGAL